MALKSCIVNESSGIHMSFVKSNLLEMLSAREQLMEDIDGICDEFFCEYFPNSQEQMEELIKALCDAVCKNFPAN